MGDGWNWLRSCIIVGFCSCGDETSCSAMRDLNFAESLTLLLSATFPGLSSVRILLLERYSNISS